MDERLLIVGDIHGEADLLLQVLNRSEVVGRKILFLGDLVNRGPATRRVLEMASVLVEAKRAIVLRGNHEDYLLEFLKGGSWLDFIAQGGSETVLDYLGIAGPDAQSQFQAAFPKRHRELLEGAPTEFRMKDLIARHLPPTSGELTETDCLWVCGHRHFEPTDFPGRVRSLGDPYLSGKVSGLLWPELKEI